MWQRFLGQEEITGTGYNQTIFPRGFTANDGLFKTIGEYQSEVVPYYNGVSQLNNNYIYLTRPKIEMLTFAQRSDYHPIPLDLHQLSPTGEKWWYGYNTHNAGSQVTDNGKQVIKCTGGQGYGFVVKDLRPTWEQVKGAVPNNFFEDAQYSWYIKPRIRIPIATQFGTKICRIDIFKKDGNLLDRTLNDSIIIRRENLDFPDSVYYGQYLEEFNLGDPYPLEIFNGAALYGNPSNPNGSQVDYAIWWYGNCDMWLEHVRVENDWAYRLFNDEYLQSDKEWIKWEVQNIADNITRPYKFLVDESDYNMYPAIGYLNQKINSFRQQNPKLSLIALNNIVYTTPEQRPCETYLIDTNTIKADFLNSGMNEVFTDLYPLYADRYSDSVYGLRQYVPSTLPVYNYANDKGRLGEPVSPYSYELNLNENLDNPVFHYIDFLKTANMISRNYNVPHIAAIQIHSWYNGAEGLYSLREPTNQEIEMLAGIAITYGAKGIIYHSYNSEGELGANQKYSRGLIGEFEQQGVQNCGTEKRIHNAYNQLKWDTIVNLTAKLKNLGSEIIKFDNTKTYSFRYHNITERTVLTGNTYFNKIITF
ncbi:MAG: hypothetical protein L0Y76_10865, partial [Ignavibacteria bacterium]|nr:hypothetical protein [Ignavibacteria bacterium]